MSAFSFGGGKGKSSTKSPAAKALTKMAKQVFGETTGARTGLIDAMEEVLATGGSSVPIISRSVEASRQAGSQALSDTDERLALMGLSGTPEGENIRAGTSLGSEIAAGQTEQSLAQQIFSQIGAFVSGQGSTAFSGLSGAIPGSTKTKESAKAFGK